MLVIDGLDPAPAGKTYEMWVVSHGGPGTRRGVPGRAPARGRPGRRVGRAGQVVLVTVEEEGGVDAPTSEPIFGTMPV